MPSQPAAPGAVADRCEEQLALHGPERAFNDDGVDLTQIRVALDRTPLERLLHHEASADSLRWMLGAAVIVKRPDGEGV